MIGNNQEKFTHKSNMFGNIPKLEIEGQGKESVVWIENNLWHGGRSVDLLGLILNDESMNLCLLMCRLQPTGC